MVIEVDECDVCAELDEQQDEVVVLPLARQVQRGVLTVVLLVAVGAVLEQNAQSLQVAWQKEK